jgi:hypothetical protein
MWYSVMLCDILWCYVILCDIIWYSEIFYVILWYVIFPDILILCVVILFFVIFCVIWNILWCIWSTLKFGLVIFSHNTENLFWSNMFQVLVLLCVRNWKFSSCGSVPICSVKCELSLGGQRDEIGGSSDNVARANSPRWKCVYCWGFNVFLGRARIRKDG